MNIKLIMQIKRKIKRLEKQRLEKVNEMKEHTLKNQMCFDYGIGYLGGSIISYRDILKKLEDED